MNNFSPSTDTSVGTKRFTAQEVQLAYTSGWKVLH